MKVAGGYPVTARFWAPRIEINRTVTVPYAFRQDEETGRYGVYWTVG
jgi:hypothetical protein